MEQNISISKEQLAGLPTVAFPGQITVVDAAADVGAAVAELRRCATVGFDTETKPNFRKGQANTVSLIQLSTPAHSFLFRLNRMGFPDELRGLLEDEGVTKVGLSIKDDFHMLHQISDFEPGGFVELQDAVKAYGIADASLQKIYGILFGHRISKTQRLSNWEADSLSPGQQSYASIDAWACLKIYDALARGDFDPSASPYAAAPEGGARCE